jgi:hypothetical protein
MARPMAEFLTSQLDYVYFVHGLALVLLGAVASTIPVGTAVRLPWGWLAAFAFTQGAAEWLSLADVALGGPDPLHLAISLALLASYALLLEFARRSHRVLHGRGPGPWMTWLAACVAPAAAIFWGMTALAPVMRVFLALPASLWAGALLGVAARRTRAAGEDAGGSLDWAAVSLAVHALAAGILVPAASMVPTGWLTAEAFLATTGVPVQAVLGATIGMAALGIWAYANTLDPSGRIARKRWGFLAKPTSPTCSTRRGPWSPRPTGGGPTASSARATRAARTSGMRWTGQRGASSARG